MSQPKCEISERYPGIWIWRSEELPKWQEVQEWVYVLRYIKFERSNQDVAGMMQNWIKYKNIIVH